MIKTRVLSIYEKNQLLKYGFKDADLLNKGELPVEYLTNYVEFKNLTIKVNQDVLIPRVESEELIDLMGDFYNSLNDDIFYLEVGTGSGAISLAFYDFLTKQKKKKINKFIVTDLSLSALNLAKENFINLFGDSISNKIEFLQTDLLNSFPDQKFNLIIANLPYIPSTMIEKLDESVKNYEPLLALDGGKTGFELINKFLEQIINKNILKNNGKIFLEVYEAHDVKFIKNNFPNICQNFSIEEFKDQFNRQRFLILKKI